MGVSKAIILTFSGGYVDTCARIMYNISEFMAASPKNARLRYTRFLRRAEELRRVRPVALAPYEYAVYALPLPLLVMAGAMPAAGLVTVPLCLPLLYLMYRRLGVYFPLSCVFGYGLFSLVCNYDILTLALCVFLFFAFFGVVFCVQLSPYLLCATVAAAFAIGGGLCGVGLVRLVEGRPLADIAENYVVAEAEDPIVAAFAQRYYEHATIPEEMERVEKGDERYAATCTEWFSEAVGDEFSLYWFYYCVHIGGVAAAVAFLFAVALNRRTASRFDCDASEREIELSTLALGGARVERMRIADMRVPRAYLWSVFAPALIASIAVDIVGDLDFITSTIMHLFITLPSAFAFATLCFYLVELPKKRGGRIAARVAAGLGLFLVAVSPIALLCASFLGLADIIVNVRFWCEFMRQE